MIFFSLFSHSLIEILIVFRFKSVISYFWTFLCHFQSHNECSCACMMMWCRQCSVFFSFFFIQSEITVKWTSVTSDKRLSSPWKEGALFRNIKHRAFEHGFQLYNDVCLSGKNWQWHKGCNGRVEWMEWWKGKKKSILRSVKMYTHIICLMTQTSWLC